MIFEMVICLDLDLHLKAFHVCTVGENSPLWLSNWGGYWYMCSLGGFPI